MGLPQNLWVDVSAYGQMNRAFPGIVESRSVKCIRPARNASHSDAGGERVAVKCAHKSARKCGESAKLTLTRFLNRLTSSDTLHRPAYTSFRLRPEAQALGTTPRQAGRRIISIRDRLFPRFAQFSRIRSKMTSRRHVCIHLSPIDSAEEPPISSPGSHSPL
jgi:hypothetical protein